MIGLTAGRVATENDGLVASPEIRANPAGLRAATALLALSLRGIGVRSSVLRFAPTVHGDGDNGFMAILVGIARQRGVAAYVGDGANRWPAVHRSDAARLARLAVEGAPAGSVLHAAGDEGVPFREIAEAMGRHLDIPTTSVAPGDAPEHFGFLAHFAGLDSPVSAAITRRSARMGRDWAEPARGPRARPLLPVGVEITTGTARARPRGWQILHLDHTSPAAGLQNHAVVWLAGRRGSEPEGRARRIRR